MKASIRVPFFEIGVKNYIYGDDVLRLALAADKAAARYDIDVLFIAPYADIRRIADHTEHLIIFAPYMDTLRPGRGMADVLPESVCAAGARGVVINHCERPMTLPAIRLTMERAQELELLTFICADTPTEINAAAQFLPDIINPEPTELIGTDQTSSMDYVRQTVESIHRIAPHTLVEQAAGIRSGQQVYQNICAGADGTGAASGIVTAPFPCAMAEEMIFYTRKAKDDLCKLQRRSYENSSGII